MSGTSRTAGGARLAGPGWGLLVDPARPVSFTFDGRPQEGLAGDVIASALMASGRSLLSRSFKYHRPRGVLTMAGHDVNAMVQVGAEPNVRGDRHPISEGMAVTSINRLGSLDSDRYAAIGLFSRFLPVGFYYKTFFRPSGAWKYFEKPIRELAGLGKLDPKAHHGHYDKQYLFCDVLVVGGGPAGLVAAGEAAAADSGLDVLVVERDRAVGAPVRCGEGVGSKGIAEFLAPAGASWVSRRISRVIFWAPDGTEVRVAEGDVGYVLDRTRFEPALAAQAGLAGAEVAVGTEVTGMRRDGDGWRASLSGPRGALEVRARVVIGADGVESMVGRWAGLDTRVPSRDMESCAQYVVSGIDFDPDAIYLHFGDRVAPGGYAWVFPKGVGVANVGLGIVAKHGEGRPAREWLHSYLDDYFPTGTRTGYTVGGVIVHTTIARTWADALLICGDAAHMVNPLSGGGIVNAMKAGRLAAGVVIDALRRADTSADALSRYHAEWMELLGNDHVRFYRVKEALNRLDDSFFNRLARTVSDIPLQKRTLGRIFAHALVQHPTLLPVIARYFV
jgi:digeranylgeranylglycerophospholipid reductase